MDRICIFARPPILGRVKTRLAAQLGEVLALELYSAFLEDVIEAARASRAEVLLHLSEGLPEAQDLPLRPLLESLEQRIQVPGDLGARMAGAFAQEGANRARRVAIVGSDLPALDPQSLEACLEGEEGRVVLAPTPDGGFWCVAGSPEHDWASIFSGVAWSSGQERAQCEARLRGHGIEVVAGPPGRDVDTLEDLKQVMRELEIGGITLGPRSRALLTGSSLRERLLR